MLKKLSLISIVLATAIATSACAHTEDRHYKEHPTAQQHYDNLKHKMVNKSHNGVKNTKKFVNTQSNNYEKGIKSVKKGYHDNVKRMEADFEKHKSSFNHDYKG
jgi:Ni/Co efflux regulator RcnB